MLPTILACIYFISNITCDSLFLPLKNGHIKTSKRIFMHERTDVEISATTDYEVRSCLDGNVLAVVHEPVNGRQLIIVKTDSLFLSYILDTATVKKGDNVEKAQIIGKLRKFVYSRDSEDYPLIFMANKGEKAVSARRYLVFDK